MAPDEFSIFARPPPGGPLAHAETRGIPSDGRCRAGPLICLGRAGDACVVGALERVGDTLYGPRVYVKLGRRLAHAHAARQGRPDTLSQLVLHAWPAVGPRGRGLAPFSATEIKQPIMPAADAVRRRLCRSSI